MAEPTNPKGPFMKTTQSKKMVEAIRQNKCSFCGKDLVPYVGHPQGFTDTLSAKEYLISGACQVCQDEIFNEEEE